MREPTTRAALPAEATAGTGPRARPEALRPKRGQQREAGCAARGAGGGVSWGEWKGRPGADGPSGRAGRAEGRAGCGGAVRATGPPREVRMLPPTLGAQKVRAETRKTEREESTGFRKQREQVLRVAARPRHQTQKQRAKLAGPLLTLAEGVGHDRQDDPRPSAPSLGCAGRLAAIGDHSLVMPGAGAGAGRKEGAGEGTEGRAKAHRSPGRCGRGRVRAGPGQGRGA